uniref:Uncharacterized protein n=1 Tax=Anopheles darlingi TaxID=43151 RepID=A0A2M4D313_ANODA
MISLKARKTKKTLFPFASIFALPVLPTESLLLVRDPLFSLTIPLANAILPRLLILSRWHCFLTSLRMWHQWRGTS